MRLEKRMVNIMDNENREVVERFPLHLVREPTAFTSNDPKVQFPRLSNYHNIYKYINMIVRVTLCLQSHPPFKKLPSI